MNKKIVFVFTFLTLFNAVFAQQMRKSASNAEPSVEQITTQSNGNSIQIDIYFSVPVDTRAFSNSSITVNSKTIDKNTKVTFNKDGTQVRFTVNTQFPVSISLSGIKTAEGKIIPSVSANNLKGDSTWTNR